jgi:sugar fermentation stimulation protein A
VSKRASKHMRELTEMVHQGHRAVVFFLVSRGGIECMRPADEIDPTYGEALRAALDAGVEVLAYRLNFDNDTLTVSHRVPVQL